MESDLGPCEEHTKTPDTHGYGRVHRRGKQVLAHRAAYCDANNVDTCDIAGKVVRHRCDNPKCVRPGHLLLGTQADNIRDMDERGRRVSLVGTELPQAILNEAAVLAMRAASGTLAAL